LDAVLGVLESKFGSTNDFKFLTEVQGFYPGGLIRETSEYRRENIEAFLLPPNL
jgi:hypothetical protein